MLPAVSVSAGKVKELWPQTGLIKGYYKSFSHLFQIKPFVSILY